MGENKKQHPRIAMSSKMTQEQCDELVSLEEGNPNGEEYSKRLDTFYKKHNFRSATLEERWAMDSEQ